MIVLDTNVISELWKVSPDPGVFDWIDAQVVETLYLSAIDGYVDANRWYFDYLLFVAKVAS